MRRSRAAIGRGICLALQELGRKVYRYPIMGCDIYSFAEVKQLDGSWKYVGLPVSNKGWWAKIVTWTKTMRWEKNIEGDVEDPFYWRDYGLFGVLANVRNYSYAPPIAEPKNELPADASPEVKAAYEDRLDYACHATSLTLRQMLEYDYEQVFWDRRITKQIGPNTWYGAATAQEGEGRHIKVRDFLGKRFFEHLDKLKSLGSPDEVRIVFWFEY